MKEAIESSRGVRGVSVKMCSPPNVLSNKSFKWEEASFVSNLYYGNQNQNNGDQTLDQRDFIPLKPRRTGGRTPVTEVEGNSDCVDESSDESTVDVDATNKCRLFTCPEEGCAKTFTRHSSLVKHLD